MVCIRIWWSGTRKMALPCHDAPMSALLQLRLRLWLRLRRGHVAG
jgi:hypothetical protein